MTARVRTAVTGTFTSAGRAANLSDSMQKVFDKLGGEGAR
jgi:hypothetical protein